MNEIQHKIYITFNQGTTKFIFPGQPGEKYFSLGKTKKNQVFEDGLSLKSLVVILVLIFGT